MEILTANRRKVLRLQGEMDGLRRAKTVIADANYLSRSALETSRALIDVEIQIRMAQIVKLEAAETPTR